MAAKPRTVAKTAVKKKTASTEKKTRAAATAKKPSVRSAGVRRKTERTEKPASAPRPARRAAPRSAPVQGPAPAIESRIEQECNIVRFGADCTRHRADELRTLLGEQLSRGLPMLLDASAIEEIDTAGVQLLVALSIDCMERGIPFHWKGRSASTERAVGRLGVAPLLESPGGIDRFSALL